MAILPATLYRKASGFTLIEVLVALAVVSIALTAIIKAVSDNIRSTDYLQNKTIATYVAEQVLNEARVGLLKVTEGALPLDADTRMLGSEWHWQAIVMKASNQQTKKIVVRVYRHDKPIVVLEGYQYHDQ